MDRDPRLLELELLMRAERATEEGLRITPIDDVVERHMVVSLLIRGILHDPSHARPEKTGFTYGREAFIFNNENERMARASQVATGIACTVHLGHAGRLRIAELRDQLRFARRTEKFGLLWDGSHWKTDVGAALTEASDKSPLGLAVFDANGMKQINDKHGHPAGDEFLRVYFSTVKATFSGVGEAYCFGGDEVGVICPALPMTKLALTARAALTALGHAEVRYKNEVIATSITCAAGVATTTDPEVGTSNLIERADGAEKNAKTASRSDPKRPSVLVVDGVAPEILDGNT